MNAPRSLSALMLLAALSPLTSGCSRTPEAAIVGTWTMNGELTMPLLTQGPELSAMMMEVGSATYTYNFAEGGTVDVHWSYGGDEWTHNGAWTVGNLDGNKQYYRIEPAGTADWSGYSVYLRDGQLNAPLGAHASERAILTQ